LRSLGSRTRRGRIRESSRSVGKAFNASDRDDHVDADWGRQSNRFAARFGTGGRGFAEATVPEAAGDTVDPDSDDRSQRREHTLASCYFAARGLFGRSGSGHRRGASPPKRRKGRGRAPRSPGASHMTRLTRTSLTRPVSRRERAGEGLGLRRLHGFIGKGRRGTCMSSGPGPGRSLCARLPSVMPCKGFGHPFVLTMVGQGVVGGFRPLKSDGFPCQERSDTKRPSSTLRLSPEAAAKKKLPDRRRDRRVGRSANSCWRSALVRAEETLAADRPRVRPRIADRWKVVPGRPDATPRDILVSATIAPRSRACSSAEPRSERFAEDRKASDTIWRDGL